MELAFASSYFVGAVVIIVTRQATLPTIASLCSQP
jgi:hypothetical protein